MVILNEARARLSVVLWIILVWMIPIFGPLAYALPGFPGRLRRQRLVMLLVLLICAVGSARLLVQALALGVDAGGGQTPLDRGGP
jgi:hypothetical protein